MPPLEPHHVDAARAVIQWSSTVLLRGWRLPADKPYDRSVMRCVAHALRRDNPRLTKFLDRRYVVTTAPPQALVPTDDRPQEEPSVGAMESALRAMILELGDLLLWEVALARTLTWLREERTKTRKRPPYPTGTPPGYGKRSSGGTYQAPVRVWLNGDWTSGDWSAGD